MLRIALIGCGEHSRLHHASAMARYVRWREQELELSAACDLDLPRAEAFCREFGFKAAYADWRKLVAEVRPDGVVCVMPQRTVVDMGVALLEAGVVCTIEKPLGESIAQARRLAEVAQRTGTPHMVSVNRRFSPYLNRSLEWVGQHGPVRLLRATMLRSGRGEADFLWATGIHLVDACCHLAGRIVRIEPKTLSVGDRHGQWQTLTAEFDSGIIGQVTIAPTAGAVEESYELLGQDYAIRAVVLGPEGPRATLRYRRGDQLYVERFTPAQDEPLCVQEGAYDEFAHFVACLRDRKPPTPTVADILPGMEVCFQLAGKTG